MESYTLGVLKELEGGKINIEEADARLTATPINAHERTFKPELPSWVRWLRNYVLLSGTLIVLFGAWIIVSTAQANILWLIVGLPIVLLGTLVLSLGAILYSMHWVYINVEQAHGHPKSFRFAFPLPLGLIRAGLWFAARFVKPTPRARVTLHARNWRWDAIWEDVNGFLNALERELREGRGISVNVDDKGQRVQLYWLESKRSTSGAGGQSRNHSSGSNAGERNETQFRFASNDKFDDGLSNGWAGF